MLRRWKLGFAGGSLAATALFGVVSVQAGASGTGAAGAGIAPLSRVVDQAFAAKPPTTAQCVETTGFECYSPSQLETAYEMKSLYKRGDDGRGETIALIDSYGSPTITKDLRTFDAGFGLPAPPSFKIITPVGAIPPYNPGNSLMVAWAEETSLDVEYAHAMAPGANLLLVETPVAETIGVQGFPQIIQAENDVINGHMADVISQSLATAEVSFPSPKDILKLRSAYVNAQAHHVTVLGAAGDWGPTSPSDAAETTFYTEPTVNWPASDPLVTSVGGLQLHLNAAGERVFPDNVWNESQYLGGPWAGAGGRSQVFTRPWYQDGVAKVVGNSRGLPDVSLNAAVDGGALVYMSFAGLPAPAYYIIGGTSEATPLFAGIVAVADQYAGHDLGLINPSLYKMKADGDAGLVPVTLGENTVTWQQNGRTYTVDGWTARAGYNLASGLGTIDGAKFVPELAAGG